MKVLRKISIVFVLLALGACSPQAESPPDPTLPPTETAATEVKEVVEDSQENSNPETQIVIDGKGDDWADIPVTAADPPGDQYPFTGDLAEVRAFTNDQYLYMMVDLHEDGYVGHLIIPLVNSSGQEFQLNVFPEQMVQYRGKGSSDLLPIPLESARDEVIEIKVALDVLGFTPVKFKAIETCCIRLSATEQERMDSVNGGSISELWEFEPETQPVPERTVRPVHYVLENGALSGDYLFRSFIQTPNGIEVGPDDLLYVADWNGQHIVRLSPDGESEDLGFWKDPAIFAYSGPQDIAFDSAGTMYFSDGNYIYKAIGDGEAEVLDGVTGKPNSLAFGPDDTLYYGDTDYGVVYQLEIGGKAKKIAEFESPWGIAVGQDGSVYVAIWPSGEVMRLDPETKEVSQIRPAAEYEDPTFLVIDPDGDIWSRGIFNVRQFGPDGSEKSYWVIEEGETTPIPGRDYNWGTAAGISFDSKGNMWIASYNSKVQFLELTNPGDAEPVFQIHETAVGFMTQDIDVGPDGSVYANNPNAGQLWQISPSGEVIVLVDHGSNMLEKVAVNPDGVVYYTYFAEIMRVEPDGSSTHYAYLDPMRMVFGHDGVLYASISNPNNSVTLVRVTGVDQVETVATGIGDEPFSSTELYLMRGPDNDLLVMDKAGGRLYRFDPESGTGELVGETRWLDHAAASPITGTVYYTRGYLLYSIDLSGNVRLLGTDFNGDPFSSAVSPDGMYLYVGESGVIDRIYIGDMGE